MINESTPSEQHEGIVEEEEALSLAHLPPPITSGPQAGRRGGSISTSVKLHVKAWRWLWSFRFQQIWASVIGPRRQLSKTLHELKHSRNLQYALKSAIGIALLAIPAFLPNDKGGPFLPYYTFRYL